MSARGDDVLRIPIEIKTEDIAEIREIIQGLKEAEQSARSAVPTTKAKALSGEERTATRTQPFEERGGIFGGKEAGKEQQFRDKTGKQAFVREDAFSQLKDQVNAIQDTQIEGLSAMDALFGGAILSQGAGGKFKAGVGLAKGGIGGVVASMKGLAVKLIPILIPAMLAFGLADTIKNELIREGGAFDRRLKILIERQFFKLSNRKEIAELREGVRELRVTAVTGQRGPSPVVNVKDFFRRGIPFIHPNQEALEKGLLP